MADIYDIDLQVKEIKNLDGQITHAKNVCERLKKEEPDSWSWVTIHAGNNEEIHLSPGEHPAITKGWMIEFVENYILEPLYEQKRKATEKLRSMISEEYL